MKLEEFVALTLKNDHSGHGFSHAERVVRNARLIQAKEGGDLALIVPAAWLHDCADSKLFPHVEEQNEAIRAYLVSEHYTPEQCAAILSIINHISFHLHETKITSLEQAIVMDADRLEALGAIGLIRTIEYGASRGRDFYEEANLLRSEKGVSFRSPSATTLSHFYEKLLLLQDLFQTATGRQMAEKRTQFLKDFLAEFYEEIE